MIGATHPSTGRSRGSLDLRIVLGPGAGLRTGRQRLVLSALWAWDKPRPDPTQGTVVCSAVCHPQRRGLLLSNGILKLQTRCSHRASPYAQSRATPGSLFLRAWRSVCFLQQQGPPLQPGQG